MILCALHNFDASLMSREITVVWHTHKKCDDMSLSSRRIDSLNFHVSLQEDNEIFKEKAA